MTTIDTSKTTWDLSPLLASDNDPKIKQYRQEFQEAVDAFTKKWSQRDDYLKDPVILLEALSQLEQLARMKVNGGELYYFGLRTSVDSIDPHLKAKENQALEFTQQQGIKLQFFPLKVGTTPAKQQPAMLADKGLQPYRHWLERQFEMAKHSLSEAEEKILTLKATPAHSLWVQMTSDAITQDERKVVDESGTTITATEEQLEALMSSQQKPVRDGAAKAFNAMLADHLDMAVAEVNAILGNKKIDDELRGFERPDQARHASDDLDSRVVDALIAAVSGRQAVSQRFYKLRAQLVGLPHLAYHERSLKYGDDTITYAYPEAAQLISDTFDDLDSEFGDIFRSFLQKGQIDAFPRKGKRGGAFCAHYGLEHPSYVLLNHTDKLRDVTTIAHEMGHAINNELIRKQQNELNFGTPMATAEVASTFMEDFVTQRLLKEADPEAELVLRVEQLDGMISSVFRQAAFYRFEQALHQRFRKDGYVPGDQIGELFRQELAAYMGPTFQGLQDAVNWWTYVPHFRNFFYVYSYASGTLISKSLQAQVKQDKRFIEKVKVFLAAGLSRSPQEIFAAMGIDILDAGFWERGLDQIDAYLTETEALAKKLGKI